jgi:eukaryotic-like serine/threonine-protein kinase
MNPDLESSGATERELFLQALDQPTPEARAAFLDAVCAANPELRASVESLLAQHREDDFLEDPAPEAQAVRPETPDGVREGVPVLCPVTEQAGDRIGRYKLVQKLGEGGYGAVYMAEQEEPIRRRVALKVIKQGMDTKQVIARFEAERQSLALMDHPHIAKVLDAGATDSGRPYFVMELVSGIRITDYCDQNNLSTLDRLKLFVQVCQAVQHAHQKGIIHRDLKPSNILVNVQDGVPVPKVIDFGIAKATEPRLSALSQVTAEGQFIGTPAYMSPEQAELSALGIDTRSDIYALGVVLYELLTGRTPFDAKELLQAGLDEIRRVIREQDPPRPSTRLSTMAFGDLTTVARHRHVEPPKLLSLVRGDLDWIVMKCLEKDRTRRYETASAFAEDIHRHLRYEAVMAGPPSAVYRARKFFRRNRVPVAVAASVTAALVVGLFSALAGFNRARHERDRAKQAEADAKAVLGFFQDRVLATARPEGQKGGLGIQTTVRGAVDAAEPAVATSFTNQMLPEASIRQVLGGTYVYLGEYGRAIRQFERARDLYCAKLGSDHPDALKAVINLATAYNGAGRPKEAVPLFEASLNAMQIKLGADHPDTLTVLAGLAKAYQDAGRVKEALPLFDKVVATRNARLGSDDPETLTAENNLAVAYQVAGRRKEALALFETVLKRRKAKLGPDHPDTLSSIQNLATTYQEMGRLQEAITLLESAIEQERPKLGADHPFTLNAMNSLGEAYRGARRLQEAMTLHEEVLKQRNTKLGPDHPDTLTAMSNLAMDYRETNRLQEAVLLFERVLAMRKAKLGPEHRDTLVSVNNLAGTYWDTDHTREAIPLFEEVLKAMKVQLGADHSQTLIALNNLAKTYQRVGRLQEAIPLLEDAVKMKKNKVGSDHASTLASMNNLAEAYRDTGRLEDSVWLFEEVLKQRRTKLGPGDPFTLASLAGLAGVYARSGSWSNAVEHYRALTASLSKDFSVWYVGGAAALAAGGTNYSRMFCQGMLARFGTNRNSAIRERLAKTLLLAPEHEAYLEPALTLTTQGAKDQQLGSSYELVRGMAEYRRSNWRDALAWLEKGQGHREPEAAALADCFCAMARHRLGQETSARETLERAGRWFQCQLPTGDLGNNWRHWAFALAARSEAERLILGREVSPPITTGSLAAARGQWKAARQLLDQGHDLASNGKWQESRQAYAQALRHPAFDWRAAQFNSPTQSLSLQMGTVFARTGDSPSHELECRLLLATHAETPWFLNAESYARTCFLSANGLSAELGQRALALARFTVTNWNQGGDTNWIRQSGGMAEYRTGQYERAIELFEKAEQSMVVPCKAAALIYRAMALKRLGRGEEAAEVLSRAGELLAEPLSTRSGWAWWDLDFCELGLNEARQMMGQK